MKINRENIDNVNATIRVFIEKSDYEKNVADKFKEYRQKAVLPGFRPGKVPAGIIQKRFGKAILAEEVNQLLSQNLTNYLRDEKINLIGDPLPNEELQPKIDFETQNDFEFVFDIAVSPEIDLTLVESNTIDYYRIKVDDELLNENIEQIRSRYGQNIDTNEVTKEAFVRADFSELDDEGNEIEAGINASNVLISVDQIKDEEVLNNFIGKTIDETVVFNPVKAFDNHSEVSHMMDISYETAKNLESNFKCTIKSIQVFEKADVNENLFKKMFGDETEILTQEQFIEKVKENISISLENNSKQRFETDAKKALIDMVPVELPETFLKRWLRQTNKELTDEQIEKDFDGFRVDIKWQLIKNDIINKNQIEVSEEETLGMARNVALSQYQQYGIFQVADEHLDSFAHRILEREEDRERIVRRIFEIKVFDLVREKVKLREKEITTEEFKALYS